MQLSLLSNYTIIEARFRLLFSLSRSTFGCPLLAVPMPPRGEEKKGEEQEREEKRGRRRRGILVFLAFVSVTWVSVEWILRDGRDWTRRPPRPFEKATAPMLFVEGTSKSR